MKKASKKKQQEKKDLPKDEDFENHLINASKEK